MAVAILSMVAVVAFTAYNSMLASQRRQVQSLGAAEVCNRLILQYLDDKTSIPAPLTPIAYGGDLYHWSLDETPVALTPARPEVAAERADSSSITVDRIQAVHVSAWLSEESGGSVSPDGVVPFFAMTRLIDPIATRNLDSFGDLLANRQSAKYQEYMANLAKYSTGGGRTRSGRGSTSTPRTPPVTQPAPTPAKPATKGGGK
jgi:type II secretory pathway pseudopilin PulG